jgi:hypothetical protein
MKRKSFFAISALMILLAPAGGRGWGGPEGDDQDLKTILDQARMYCARLDEAALDFACREEVKEEANIRKGPLATSVVPSIDNGIVGHGSLRVAPARPESFLMTISVYDYLFVRKGGEVRERRDLILRDGKKVEKKEAEIETRHFKSKNDLFGPSLLLGEAAAADHVFKFVKAARIKGQDAFIVACEAQPEKAGKVLAGQAWIRSKDGAVLRIAWAPESFSGYGEVEAVAEELRMSPAILSETEFGIERNGLRFPSRDRTEETYKSGTMTFTRSITTIRYLDYKFFTVDTAVEIR